jgi:NAD(P)H-dependent FMN reductase|tara:strand:+ start:673 stop:1203 length:531 start_codon:yes stop_codon:yes gene_type:complete
MKKIIAFAGSNSKNSINKSLARFTSTLVKDVETEVLDLNDFELPIYGIDEEIENGIPENANKFLDILRSSDGIILSLAEHNGAYTTVFKNLFDWMSRIDGKLWSDKPMLLMSTSPGGRGGATVLEIARGRFPYMGGNIVSTFSLPSFNDNFKDESFVNKELKTQLDIEVLRFQQSI